jgi:hypothetical protein
VGLAQTDPKEEGNRPIMVQPRGDLQSPQSFCDQLLVAVIERFV